MTEPVPKKPNSGKRQLNQADNETKLSRSLSDKGAARIEKTKELFNATLEQLKSCIDQIDVEIDRLAIVLRYAQPPNFPGNVDIRWWIRRAEVRKPILIQWIKKPGFPKLVPKVIERFHEKNYLKFRSKTFNSEIVFECVEKAKVLMRHRDELNNKISVFIRGLGLSLAATKKNMVEMREMSALCFLKVGQNMQENGYPMSPSNMHREYFTDIDFEKKMMIQDSSIESGPGPDFDEDQVLLDD